MSGVHPPDDFPPPDADAAELSAELQTRLRAAIDAAGGAIPFDRYMEFALYAPGLGYYSNGLRKFGSGGDFVTAPEISDLFGRCIARSIAPVLKETAGDVLELGAGSGVLAVDLLGELQVLDALPARYLILERSGELRARQQARLSRALADMPVRIEWLDSLPGQAFDGVVFANEVVDALPVKRFRWQPQASVELGVGWRDGRLAESDLPLTGQRLQQFIDTLAVQHHWEAGYESEWCPSLPAWIAGLAGALGRGLLLFVDYGYGRAEYYHPQRARGTLMCHYRHRVHPDPLLLPGLQDITAYVDFTALAEAASGAGLALAGYTSQANFLLDCGLESMLAAFDPRDRRGWLKKVSELKTLVMPGEMGERFKVMALTKGIDAAPGGFGGRDLRGGL